MHVAWVWLDADVLFNTHMLSAQDMEAKGFFTFHYSSQVT